MAVEDIKEKLSRAGVNPAILQLLHGPRPAPLHGEILEAEQTGINDRGIPQYQVARINKEPADSATLVPIVQALARGGHIRNHDTVAALADHKGLYIPDYGRSYLTNGNLTSGQRQEVSQVRDRIEQGAIGASLEALQQKIGKSEISNAVVEETSAATKAKVQELIGTGHMIGHTVRAANLMATEVFPRVNQVLSPDPVLCAMIVDDRRGMNRTLNSYLQAAFITAVIGRVNEGNRPIRERFFRQAANYGRAAGNIGYSNCMADVGGWKLGDLMLLFEVFKGNGEVLIHGFDRLPKRGLGRWF